MDRMRIIAPLIEHDLIDKMKMELPAYLASCAGFSVDHADVEGFTVKVLNWWADHNSKFPSWAIAARIVFSFTPNSAASERVFSMLKCLFGDSQMATLADYIQVALMLRYNKRKIG